MESLRAADTATAILYGMVLHLNPRFPLVWRSPTSLQFGVEHPPVVLTEVSNAEERILAAMRIGVTRPGLSMIANSAGATESQLEGLLTRLHPLLAPTREPPTGTVAVIGTTTTASQLRATLRESGCSVIDPGSPVELGIIISHYVVEPDLFGFWLRQDTPHLPIVFSDSGVRIGPMVEPGSGPCLYCLELHRTDADPAWPAIASQLWRRISTAETAVLSNETTAIALRMALARLRGAPATGEAESVFVDGETGSVTRQTWRAHSDCGCAALPENDWVPGLLSDPARQPTTTSANVGALG